MSDLVLTTTGFVLPKKSHFTEYDDNVPVGDSIFGRNLVSGMDDNITAFLTRTEIFRVDRARSLLDKYNRTNSIDDYLEMVEFTVDTLKDITVLEFFYTQAANRHITKTVYTFLELILNGNYSSKSVMPYIGLPYRVRFTLDNGADAGVIHNRKKQIDTKFDKNSTWSSVMTEMVINKTMFVTFFSLVFVDDN